MKDVLTLIGDLLKARQLANRQVIAVAVVAVLAWRVVLTVLLD